MDLTLDLSLSEHEPLTHTNQKLLVVPAQTRYHAENTRAVFLKIEGTIEPLLIFMFVDKDVEGAYFSGRIVIAELDGEFKRGFRVENGVFTHSLVWASGNYQQRGSNSGCGEHRENNSDCYFCKQFLDAVVIRGSSGPPVKLKVNIYPGREGGSGMGWDYGGGGGGGSLSFSFDLNLVHYDEGDKPLEEYDDKCLGIDRIWQLSSQSGNEYAAVLTIDGAILITQQLSHNGGGINGIYVYNGTTYYQYPVSQGAPERIYSGQIIRANRYFIPIKATIHSHTPCITDGTDGVSNNIIDKDQKLAAHYPNINHYILGCGAIGQFDQNSNRAFNIQHGALDDLCGNIN